VKYEFFMKNTGWLTVFSTDSDPPSRRCWWLSRHRFELMVRALRGFSSEGSPREYIAFPVTRVHLKRNARCWNWSVVGATSGLKKHKTKSILLSLRAFPASCPKNACDPPRTKTANNKIPTMSMSKGIARVLRDSWAEV
jgi:hypothetical protein